MKINISKCMTKKDLEISSSIRKMVFGDEEKAPEGLYIIDEKDLLDTTCNFIASCDEIPVATIRYIEVDKKTIKIQRLAVLKEYRRKGIAKKLLSYLENYAKSNNYKYVIMDSAQKAVEFYKDSGYKEASDVFFEDKRPHVKMEKELK